MTSNSELNKRLANDWTLPVKDDPRAREIVGLMEDFTHVMDCCAGLDTCIGAHPSELVDMLRYVADLIDSLTDYDLPVGPETSD